MYLEQIEKLSKRGKASFYQKQALEKLHHLPLPDRKVEEYYKVGLSPLLDLIFVEPTPEEEVPELLETVYPHVRLHNGRLVSIPSPLPAPVHLSSIEEAFVTYASFMHSHLGKRIEEESDFFALAAESFQEGGAFLYIPPKTRVSLPLHFFTDYLGKNRHITTKIQIVVGRESACEIICESRAKEFINSAALEILDVVVERGASCRITDLNFVPKEAVCLRFLRSVVKEGGSLQFVTATNGSSLYRFHYGVELKEEEASCDLQGVWYLQEDRKAHFSGEVKHMAPHTKSNQHFKGVLVDKSRSTFTGKIFVASVAQKTEAYQLNNNLVLGEGANAFAKPHLEIFADDVKASHGATISQLSAEELFYMRSRGYEESLAREVLMKGFLEEILRSIPYIEVANKVREQYVVI